MHSDHSTPSDSTDQRHDDRSRAVADCDRSTPALDEPAGLCEQHEVGDPARRWRILLVEDNDGDARLVVEALASSSDFEIVRATDLTGALQQADSVDLILTDLGLPDAEGLGALDRFLSATPDLPIVVLTGLADDRLGRQAVQRGAQDFVHKSGSEFASLSRTLRYSLERNLLNRRLQELNRRLTALSVLDPLTEALNRRGLEEVFANETSRARRAGGTLAALLIDCDDFKRINDELGHSVGDAVLAEVARRIDATKRGPDALGRIGGDEFLLLLPNTRLAEASIVAERVRLAVSSTLVLHEPKPVQVTLSIGVTTVPLGIDSVGELLSHTRDALRTSKRSGKNQVTRSGEDGVATEPTAERLRSLVAAAASGRGLRTLAQPLIRLRSGRAIGFEVLSRGPDGPFSSPTDLFRVARTNGQVMRLDLQCLKSCVQAAKESRLDGRVHVNILPSTLLEVEPSILLELLEAPRGTTFCVELSEQEFIGHPARLVEHCHHLRLNGILLAIDDIGSGRGNLDSVILLEPDIIKIDISLVRGAAGDPEKYRLIERLVLLADALEVEVVAEGIEDEIDRQAMIDLGIDLGQGYYWSEPLPLPTIVGEWSARR